MTHRFNFICLVHGRQDAETFVVEAKESAEAANLPTPQERVFP